MNINNKLLLMLVYTIIFFATSLASSKFSYLKLQDLGQMFGLGGVVIGYFAAKKFKK